MKKRLIITIVAGILQLVGSFFSSKSITFLTFIACPPSSLVFGSIFLLGLFVVTIWNSIGIFRMWREHKVKAFIPFAICVFFFFLDSPVSKLGLDLRIEEFKVHLPEFQKKAEAVVEELHDRNKSATHERPSNHFGTHAGFNIYASTDTNGVPTIRFVKVITMNFHHRGYMYRPDGNFSSAIREREWLQRSINEKWCAIGD